MRGKREREKKKRERERETKKRECVSARVRETYVYLKCSYLNTKIK